MRHCKDVYVIKSSGANLYTWSPGCPDFSKKRTHERRVSTKPSFCTAIAGSQGQDWETNYVYDLTLIDGQLARLAYVECDYVE